jgi:hypothetical protein
MSVTTYAEKLKDPRWQRLRLEIMQRDKFECRLCGDAETTLNIHHLSYFKNPWDCPPEQLITLCEDCHSILTINKFDLNREQLEVKRILREGHKVFLVFFDVGLYIYSKEPGKAIRKEGLIGQDIMKIVIHDIINYWLRTDKEHYLTEKLTADNG